MKRTPAQTRRLWQLVELMKYDPDPVNFTMLKYRHQCGAPACLLGHAWDRWQEQDNTSYSLFGVNDDEHWYLFGRYGVLDGDRKNDTPAIAASRVIDVIYGC